MVREVAWGERGSLGTAMLIVCPSCATAFRVNQQALGSAGRQVRCAACRTVWLATPESALPEPAAAATAPEPPRAAAPEPPRTATSESRPKPAPAAPPADDDADWGAAFAEEARNKPGAGQDSPVTGRGEAEPPLAESPPLAPPGPAEPIGTSTTLVDDDNRATPSPPPRRTMAARVAGLKPRLSVRPSQPAAWRLSLPVVIIVIGVAILATFLLGREHVVRTVPDSATVYEHLGMPVNLRGIDFRDVRGANEVVDGVVVLVVEGRLVNISNRVVPLPRLRLAVRDRTGKEIYTWNAAPPKAQLEPGEATPFRSRLASPPPDGASVEVRFFTVADAAGR